MTARWALLAGGKGTGKSSVASRVATELAQRGVVVGGVVQDAIEEDGDRVGYRARHVGGTESVVVGRKGAAPPDADPEALCSFCSFVFDPRAFDRAHGWIRQGVASADVVIIDEVSKLEVAQGGHCAAIREALAGKAIVLLVVRADQLFDVVERFGLGDALATLDAADEPALAPFVDELARAARSEAR
jgi:nucleoside-triphosphatase THEP1